MRFKIDFALLSMLIFWSLGVYVMKKINITLIFLSLFSHVNAIHQPWKLYETPPKAMGEYKALFWLTVAAWRGDVDKVKEYLPQVQDVNTYVVGGLYRTGPTIRPLWIAVANGHTEIVRLLLAAGANPNQEDDLHLTRADEYTIEYEYWGGPLPAGSLRDKSLTPLMAAAIGGYKPIVELLLDSGADPSKIFAGRFGEGKTAGDYASTPEIANLIKQYMTGAKKPTYTLRGKPIAQPTPSIQPTVPVPPIFQPPVQPTTPIEPERYEYTTKPEAIKFWYAAYYGDREHLKKYLQSTPDINAKEFRGGDQKTALIAAIENRQPVSIPILLQHGANPNIADSSGIMPIIHAVYRGMLSDIFQMLLDNGANPNATDYQGQPLIDMVIFDQALANLIQSYINGTRQPTFSLMPERPNPLTDLMIELQNLQRQLTDLNSKLSAI